MAIRPVDMQVLMHKATETNRAEQGEGRRPEVAHQEFAQVMQKHTEDEQRQVLQTNKTEQDNIDQDGKGHNKYERRRREKQKEEEARQKRQQASMSMFDVSI